MKAIPLPLAPLQAIKQQESGVVVMTNPPRALTNSHSVSQFPTRVDVDQKRGERARAQQIQNIAGRLTEVSDFPIS